MYLVGNVLFDADELVTAFVRRQLSHAGVYASDGQPLINATLGVVANGRIVGGVLYFNWRRHDIEIAAAFELAAVGAARDAAHAHRLSVRAARLRAGDRRHRQRQPPGAPRAAEARLPA